MPMALTKETSDPLDVRLFHVTHHENLESIVNCGILPLNAMRARALTFRSIAYPHLQERRDATTVPVAPGGPLHDYVPWGFAARPPMLYSAFMGLLGPGVLQTDIVHLVSTVQSAQKLNLQCV